MPGRVQLGEIADWLSATLPEDAVVANGAGNFAVWLNRNFNFAGLHFIESRNGHDLA